MNKSRYTAEEIAGELGVSVRTWRRWAAAHIPVDFQEAGPNGGIRCYWGPASLETGRRLAAHLARGGLMRNFDRGAP